MPDYLIKKADSGFQAQQSSSTTFENEMHYVEPIALPYNEYIIHEAELELSDTVSLCITYQVHVIWLGMYLKNVYLSIF